MRMKEETTLQGSLKINKNRSHYEQDASAFGFGEKFAVSGNLLLENLWRDLLWKSKEIPKLRNLRTPRHYSQKPWNHGLALKHRAEILAQVKMGSLSQ
ncbi:hypothetical protein J0S82_002491, partial [Galemys pyrenaicus]